MEIITIEACTFEAWKKKFEDFIERIDTLCAPHQKQNETWLDNSDVCRLLNVSSRTMQTYRDTGKLPYSQINGKLYYKTSDIKNFVQSKMSKANK